MKQKKRRAPVILLSASHDIDEQSGEAVFLLNQRYVYAVREAGGCPVLAVSDDLFEEYANLADGLILTGGWVSSPRNIETGVMDQAKWNREVRNPYDLALYRAFRNAGKPVLGICQGLLVINEGQGGTTGRDLPAAYHVEHGNGICHPVAVEKGNVLWELFGGEFVVNSHHSWYAKELGDGLRVIARSPEGVVEAVMHDSLPILGVQWHPERMRGEERNPVRGEDMGRLFCEFVRRCREMSEKKDLDSQRPVLLVTGELKNAASNMHYVPLFVLRKCYSSAIEAAGGIPLLALDVCQEENYLSFCDGLILTDGGDIHPGRYGEICLAGELAPNVSYQRDNLEFDLFDAFYRAGYPVFGINRGQLLINAALGGTVCQDDGTGRGQQIVGKIAPGLHAVSTAEDGAAEGLEHENGKVRSIQWSVRRTEGGFGSTSDDLPDAIRDFLRECFS